MLASNNFITILWSKIPVAAIIKGKNGAKNTSPQSCGKRQ